MKRSIQTISACGVALVFSACGGGKAVSVNFVNPSGATLMSQLNRSVAPAAVDTQILTAAGWGSAAPASFKVAIYDLSVCKDMDISDSGYTNADGCQKLFEQTDDHDSYNAGTVPSGVEFLDLMKTAATKATIAAYGAKIKKGTYKYGKINAYRQMKVTGSVALSSGGTAYTRADATNSTPTNLNWSVNYSPTMTTGPAQEATIVWNQNGFFKFQTPWEFDGESDVSIDIVFNPEDILKGTDSCTNCIISQNNTSGAGINIPILKLTPVVRKATEVTLRERYTFQGGTGQTINGKLTVDLYSIKGDSARTIYGADVRMAYLAGQTTTGLSDPFSAQEVEVSGDVVKLKDWQGGTIASFTRAPVGTTSAVTVSATASVTCEAIGVCQASSGTASLSSYTAAFTELN